MIKNLLNSRPKIWQISTLYLSSIVGLLVALLISILNARILGPQSYGDLKFVQTALNLIFSLSTFGVVVSGTRLVALEEDTKKRSSLVGALICIVAIISILLCVFTVVFSYYEEGVFDNNIGYLFRLSAPFVFAYPFNYCLKNIMQGENRIFDLSVLRIAPQVLYVAVLGVCYWLFSSLSIEMVLLINLTCLSITVVFYTIKRAPAFTDIKANISLVLLENRRYGWPVYIGMIANVATQQMGIFFIAYFSGNVSVGFYSLALMTTAPLAMVPLTVGTVFFRDFSKRDAIPSRCIVFAVVSSSLVLLVYLLAIGKIFIFCYSEKYASAIPLAYIICFGSISHGFGDMLNRFLGAHGKGMWLRNCAIVQGLFNVIGFSCLVPVYGPYGAAYTKFLSGIVYLGMMLKYYYGYAIKSV